MFRWFRRFTHFRFDDPREERAYLQFSLSGRQSFLRVICRTGLVVLPIYIVIDASRFDGWETGLVASLCARVIAITAIALLHWKIPRLRTIERFNRWVSATVMIFIAHLLVVNQFQLDDSIAIAAWTIVMVFVFYTLLPTSLERQVLAGVILTIGTTTQWLLTLAPEARMGERIDVPLAYIVANVFGIAFSIQRKTGDRREFLRLREEKKLRRSVSVALRRLRLAVDSKERLFALISHDLRGPIGTMAAIGELLTGPHDQVDPVVRERLTRALVRSAETTHELLTNLLHWALHESNSLQPNPTVWDLRPVCDQSVALLEPGARQKSVALRGTGRLDYFVQADRHMIQTVIRNLLGNALKFTAPGGRVTLSAEPCGEDRIRVRVSDTGVGMSPSRLRELLGDDPVRPSLGTNKEKGTGLGLRLCREFVRKNAGEFELTSAPGTGTTAAFTVPRAP